MSGFQDRTIRVSNAQPELLCLICGKVYLAGQVPGLIPNSNQCPDDAGSLLQLPQIDAPLVGNYLYKGVLGVGGMGVVYKALNPFLDRIVAVKNLKGKKYDAKQLQRFMQEGKLLAKLVHPNLVTVLDFGATQDLEPYMVMEYLDGTSIAGMIKRSGTVDLDTTIEILIQTCEGLEHAHNFGAVHRDIKPTNIFVMHKSGHKPQVKLLDFGIAKMWFPEDPIASSDLTRTGEIFGSPLYMSPEQALGKPVDERADLYSLGCVMYEMLSGVQPITGETAMETIFKHVSQTPRPLSEAAKGKKFPPEVQALVTCLLAKKPSDRPATAAELAKMLNYIRSSKTTKLQAIMDKAESLDREEQRAQSGAAGGKGKGKLPLYLGISAVSIALIGVICYFVFFLFAKPSSQQSKLPKSEAVAASAKELDKTSLEGGLMSEVMHANPKLTAARLEHDLASDVSTYVLRAQFDSKLALSDFQLLATKGKNINNLTLHLVYGLTPQAMSEIATMPISKLRIEYCDISDDALAVISKFQSLRELYLRENMFLTPMALKGLGKSLPLNALTIDGCLISPRALKEIFPRPYLSSLIIMGSNKPRIEGKPSKLAVNDALPEIGKTTSLNDLCLMRTDCTSAHMKYLVPLKTLRHLNLSYCKGIDDGAIDAIAKLPNLEDCDLRFTDVTVAGIEKLLRTNRRLRCVYYHSMPGRQSPFIEDALARRRIRFE